MSEGQATLQAGLLAKDPYQLRVDQAGDFTESAVKIALKTGDVGFLHSFTTGSTVDGPGVRIVAWTAGCQWRCLYCHNPDTWNMMNGMPVKLERAVDEVSKYRRGLKVMSGGLTISGGEALMQDRFVVRLFSAVKKLGVHTALDTNGYLGDRLTDEELKQVDLVILHLKAWDAERHIYLTSKPVEPTLNFARRLAQRGIPTWVRYVLIPGLTDDEEDINHISTFAAGLGNVQRVDVLPFHQMGRYKWKKLGLDYQLDDVQPPPIELVQRVCEQFRAVGLKSY